MTVRAGSRARVLAGGAVSIAGSVVALSASSAAWWVATAEPNVVRPGPGQGAVLLAPPPLPISGADFDGIVAAYAVLCMILVGVGLLSRPSIRSAAVVAVFVAVIPLAWLIATAPGSSSDLEPFGEEVQGRYDRVAARAAPRVTAAAGAVLTAGGAAWVMLAGRSAPRVGMPAGPPAEDEETRGVWE